MAAGITLLLPEPTRFGAQRLSASTARALGQATVLPSGADGRREQLRRQVQLPGDAWPLAALSRQQDAGDAAGAAWLRADPAYLRPDINGVRLMACGETLGVTQVDVDALLPSLRPVFGDAGVLLDAPHAHRWYLRGAREATLPAFIDPSEALGSELLDHLDDAAARTPEARRWRSLMNEAQIILHNHPHNAARAARGQLPINALWPWGGGTLPAAGGVLRSDHAVVHSDDPVLRSLAAAVTQVASLPAAFALMLHGAAPGKAGRQMAEQHTAGQGASERRAQLFDLEGMRDLAVLDAQWLQPALGALRRGTIGALTLDAGDGRCMRLLRADRLRFWRRPRLRLDA